MLRECFDPLERILAILSYGRYVHVVIEFLDKRPDVVLFSRFGVKSILNECLDGVVVPLSGFVLVPDFRLRVEAVPTFRGVKVRMCVSDRGRRETYHSPDSRGARVRRHAEDELADEVVALVHLVEAVEPVELSSTKSAVLSMCSAAPSERTMSWTRSSTTWSSWRRGSPSTSVS